MIIKGNTVGCALPGANWNQTDNTKADHIEGKEAVDQKIASKLQMQVVSITLPAAGWSGNSQTVEVPGVTADVTRCHPKPTPEPESHAMYYDCDVHGTAQLEGKMTFNCEEVPTADLRVTVAVFYSEVTA